MIDPVYSIVVPVFNEEAGLRELFERLGPVLNRLDGPAEVLLVDDGSQDGSFSLVCELHQKDPRFKAARLSRNFGHQTAITAGMDLAVGEAVVVMDADLQDPPEGYPRDGSTMAGRLRGDLRGPDRPDIGLLVQEEYGCCLLSHTSQARRHRDSS